MATPSTVFTELVTSTDRAWGTKVTDNVSNHNAVLRRMKDKGKIKSSSGGYEIAEPIEYAENGTYQRYGGYESLNTAASDVLTTVKYDWKQVALHVTASGKEIRMNMGSKTRMLNLVQTRKDNALRTAANQFSIDLFSDGSLTNQIGGLAHIIQNAGTGTVGGINSSTYTIWQNQVREMTGTDAYTSSTLKNEMNKLWMSQTFGIDTPDLIVASHDLYSMFEAGITDRARYTDSSSATEGIVNLKYKSADVVFDDNTNFSTTAEKMYFLNTNYLYVVQHKEAQWTPDEEKRPTNQDAIVIPVYWMGNVVCSNRSRQGVLIDAA